MVKNCHQQREWKSLGQLDELGLNPWPGMAPPFFGTQGRENKVESSRQARDSAEE